MIKQTDKFFLMSKGERLIWFLNDTTQSEFCISPICFVLGVSGPKVLKNLSAFVIFDSIEKLQNIFEKGLKNIGVVGH